MKEIIIKLKKSLLKRALRFKGSKDLAPVPVRIKDTVRRTRR